MHAYVAIPCVSALLALSARIALAAWLTSPKNDRDPDEFLRVFNGLTFDTFGRLRRRESEHAGLGLPPGRGDTTRG